MPVQRLRNRSTFFRSCFFVCCFSRGHKICLLDVVFSEAFYALASPEQEWKKTQLRFRSALLQVSGIFTIHDTFKKYLRYRFFDTCFSGKRYQIQDTQLYGKIVSKIHVSSIPSMPDAQTSYRYTIAVLSADAIASTWRCGFPMGSLPSLNFTCTLRGSWRPTKP